MKSDKLYFGAAYYAEYMPTSRIEEDMKLMKDAGMNVIRIAESAWSTWEPKDGEFDFSLLHKVLQESQKCDINVIVGTPTYAIPYWMAKKYPDILADTHLGRSVYGPRQNMDITHPGYLFHCERIIRCLMNEVQQYDHVIGFQIDNETKPYDTCGDRVQCMFKHWLINKFDTVDKMNHAFGLAFWSNSLASWEDLPDVRGTINNSLAAEFEAFQRSLVTGFLKWQRSIIDEYRRPNQFVTHNFDYEWRNYSHALQPDVDQFQAAKHVTVVGCDIYHPSASMLTGAEISFGGDLARGLKNGQNYFVLETQSQGPVNRLPWPMQLRLQAFSHLASGANMVEYWPWHSIYNAIESHWKGVLSHDSSPGIIYQEVKSIGADFTRLSPHLVNLKKKSPVAILVSNRSLTGIKHSYSFEGPNYGDIFRWMYDAFYMLNIPCDIVDDTCQDFSAYKLIVTPGLYCATDSLINALRRYVRNGGHLLSTFRSFFCDENVKIRCERQPAKMADLFGVTYDNFTVPIDVPYVSEWMELLIPDTDTQVLLSYEHPVYQNYAVATLYQYGKGSAGYIGAMLDKDILQDLLREYTACFNIDVPTVSWPLIIKEGTNQFGKMILYILNYCSDQVDYTVPTDCIELLSETKYTRNSRFRLQGWGVAIFEY